MGGFEMAASDDDRAQHGPLRHSKKRVGIKIDMTPFVDIAFLLLIFFMVTTVFRLPHAMELVLPPANVPEVPVPESNVVTMYVHGDGNLVLRRGIEGPLEPLGFAEMSPALLELLRGNDRLITIVKIDRATPYHWVVDILDEFVVRGVTRYSIEPMTGEELDVVRAGV